MLKNINYNNKIGWADLSLEARFKIVESLTSIYIGYQSIALGSDAQLKISDKNVKNLFSCMLLIIGLLMLLN